MRNKDRFPAKNIVQINEIIDHKQFLIFYSLIFCDQLLIDVESSCYSSWLVFCFTKFFKKLKNPGMYENEKNAIIIYIWWNGSHIQSTSYAFSSCQEKGTIQMIGRVNILAANSKIEPPITYSHTIHVLAHLFLETTTLGI